MAAQGYPADFDGIAAGAPVLNFSGTMYDYVWSTPRLAKAAFSAEQLLAVGRAVVERCDPIDGLKDGQITDPRRCRFDPRADLRRCPADGLCFTEDPIVALEAVHGDMQLGGKSVFPGWPWGSEAPDAGGVSGWAEWFVSFPPPPPPVPGERAVTLRQTLPPGESRQSAYARSFLRFFADQPARLPAGPTPIGEVSASNKAIARAASSATCSMRAIQICARSRRAAAAMRPTGSIRSERRSIGSKARSCAGLADRRADAARRQPAQEAAVPLSADSRVNRRRCGQGGGIPLPLRVCR